MLVVLDRPPTASVSNWLGNPFMLAMVLSRTSEPCLYIYSIVSEASIYLCSKGQGLSCYKLTLSTGIIAAAVRYFKSTSDGRCEIELLAKPATGDTDHVKQECNDETRANSDRQRTEDCSPQAPRRGCHRSKILRTYHKSAQDL